MRRPEIRARVSERMKGRRLLEATKEKLRLRNLGKTLSVEHRLAIGSGVKASPRYREALKTRVVPPNRGQFEQGHRPTVDNHGRHLSPRTEFTRERACAMWQDPRFREHVLSKLHSPDTRQKAFASRWKRPTKLERIVITLVKQHDLPFIYTGNGNFWIGNKNPDFVATDGLHLCFEVAGRYRHSPAYEHSRVSYFNACGWDAFVIWEEELENLDCVLSRIREAKCVFTS
jgi:very-short-patch-repair endonuclease